MFSYHISSHIGLSLIRMNPFTVLSSRSLCALPMLSTPSRPLRAALCHRIWGLERQRAIFYHQSPPSSLWMCGHIQCYEMSLYIFHAAKTLKIAPDSNVISSGPLLLTWIDLNPTWISNCIQYKVWNELLIHSQTSPVQALKLGNAWLISFQTLLGMRFLNDVSKSDLSILAQRTAISCVH